MNIHSAGCPETRRSWPGARTIRSQCAAIHAISSGRRSLNISTARNSLGSIAAVGGATGWARTLGAAGSADSSDMCWWLVAGGWWLVAGGWWSVVGGRWSVVGGRGSGGGGGGEGGGGGWPGGGRRQRLAVSRQRSPCTRHR